MYKQQLAEYARKIEEQLAEILPKTKQPQIAQVTDAMEYGVLGGGKRLRGALVMEFARLTGASEQTALMFACGVEMIHAYSLIHDDLPCMDNDDLRRGKPTCHKAFGETTAVLAGDALLTHGFQVLMNGQASAEQKVRAVEVLSECAGVHGMIGGQMMDMFMEHTSADEALLTEMEQKKTGCMMEAACVLGCIAGEASPAMEEIARAYARSIGLAFQMTDDVLDVTGDEKILGKPIGSDAENDKTTFVKLLGVEQTKKAASLEIEKAVQTVRSVEDNGFLVWLAKGILTRRK